MVTRKCKLIFAIFLFFLLTFLVLFFFLLPRQKNSPATVEYTLLATVREEVAAALQKGDVLIDGAGKGEAGVLTDLRISHAYEEDSLGISREKRGFVRLILSVRTPAVREHGIFHAGNLALIPGKNISLHGHAVLTGVCLSVREVPASLSGAAPLLPREI